MSRRAEARGEPQRFQLGQAERLNLPERIALLIIVGGSALLDFLGLFTAPDADPVLSAVSIATTLTFALYLWSPLVATSALGLGIALSFFVDNAVAGLVAGAIAAGLVLRLATTPLVIGYAGGFLLFNALYAFRYGASDSTPTNIALFLIFATVAGGVGLALRLAYTRGSRLEHELAERAEQERQAVLAERRWIAGELHDSIAHHLTVVAMHVQLLDDDSARPGSQDAIRVAARKALSDLRFVIELAEDAPRGTEVPSGDLAAAIDEAREEFEATGHPVACVGDPSDESIPRGAEIILARIVRESATNILKYAGPGEVRFVLELDPESIALTIRSPLPTTPRRDLPSTGTGLNRMAERVLGVSGEFSAGPTDDAWLVSARLPVA
ncbi:sensor histidine kinase [Leucobacter celer]|uniref:sensor histidine kinase n=1 Tax=Leucobacter celer TaxID=668625 RepID=UPI0009FA24F7|nr:histidine kinase [Leucobacter celer]